MTPLSIQYLAVQRIIGGKRDTIEKRAKDARWPADDVTRMRNLLAALVDVETVYGLLCEAKAHPERREKIFARIMGDAE